MGHIVRYADPKIRRIVIYGVCMVPSGKRQRMPSTITVAPSWSWGPSGSPATGMESVMSTSRSPAARAGLRAGDRLTRIDGAVIFDFIDYQQRTCFQSLQPATNTGKEPLCTGRFLIHLQLEVFFCSIL